MPNSFSKELLTDIHIRLDQEGLNGLTEKEVSVLLSEEILTSAIFIVEQLTSKIDAQTDKLIDHMDSQTEQLTTHMDSQTEQLTTHIDAQTERLIEHSEAQTDRIIQALHLLRGDIAGLRESMDNIRKDLEQSRFWAKITGIGLWAVAAGLIANLIFQMLTKV